MSNLLRGLLLHEITYVTRNTPLKSTHTLHHSTKNHKGGIIVLNEICVLTIKVANMEEAIDFYTNVLDFSVAKKYGENIISLEHKGLPLILEKAENLNSTTNSSVLLAINSSNIREDFKRLQEKGVKILFDEPKPCPPGYFFVIEDSSGNQLEIVEFVD